jgi:hypothetical protein
MSKIAYVHSEDFDTETRPDARQWDAMVNRCSLRAQDALKTPTASYSKIHSEQMADIFHSMSCTHFTIRLLLDRDVPIDPQTVDTLPLARLQLECLYAICLMLEGPKYVTEYLHDHWRKRYARYLLEKEETKNLPRAQEYYQTGEQLRDITAFGDAIGITPEQRMTVDLEEMGTPLPPNVKGQPIARFKTPGSAIPRIVSSASKKAMLERLYAKYGDLCSFAHGLAQSTSLKRLFDNRSAQRKLTTDGKIKRQYQLDIVSEAYLTSVMSVAQAAAELTVLYPNDLELLVSAHETWQEIARASLLSKAIWEIRTKALLRVI